MEPTESALSNFLSSNNLSNLMTKNTYFKGTGSCIDLILTNRKYSFKHTESYETGLEIIIIWSTQCLNLAFKIKKQKS